jgi:hypothetical protein
MSGLDDLALATFLQVTCSEASEPPGCQVSFCLSMQHVHGRGGRDDDGAIDALGDP